MLEAIEKLLVLQDRDLRIKRLHEELAQIPAQQSALRGKTATSAAVLEAAKKRVMEIESRRKELELEVKGLRERIEKYSNQQLQTKKNDEYRALANEIENCKRQIFELEDREIECMEHTEAAQKEVKSAQAVADAARREMENQIGELDARQKALEGELANFESAREEAATAVDESACHRYQRLFNSKGGRVVVGIQHGVCGGCHMRLPTQIVVQVRGEQEIVTCPNCARILYYTRDMDMVVAE
jgi:predicted  nucleic acid-binding Zn-ribbon protein